MKTTTILVLIPFLLLLLLFFHPSNYLPLPPFLKKTLNSTTKKRHFHSISPLFFPATYFLNGSISWQRKREQKKRGLTIFLSSWGSVEEKRMIKYLRIRLMLSALALLLFEFIFIAYFTHRGEMNGEKIKIGSKIFWHFFLRVAMCFICIPFLLKDNPDTSLPSWFF